MANGGTISRADYARYVEAFRALGTKFAPVARFLNIDQRTAAKAYKTGWPTIGFPAISEVLADPDVYDEVLGKPSQSQQSAPPAPPAPTPTIVSAPDSGAASVAATPPAETDAQETARQGVASGLAAYVEAIQIVDAGRAATMLEEQQVMRAIRNNVLGVQAITSKLLEELHKLAPEMIQELKILREDGTRDTIGAKSVIQRFTDVLEKSVKAFTSSVDAFGKVQEQNKLLVGEPQKITELRNTGAGADVDDADRKAEETRLLKQLINAAARRLKAADAYAGEGGAFIEVESTPARAQIAPASGEPVANETPPAPIPAPSLEVPTVL